VSVRIFRGDCRDVLKTLPNESVHCVVTSPPYFGLRDYGTAQWEGGDPECEHLPEDRGSRFATPVSAKQRSNTGSGTASNRDCSCGAHRIDCQIGLEATPDEYVAQMVAVFREVRRVLRKDGTLWLNLGDSYNSGGNPIGEDKTAAASTLQGGKSTQANSRRVWTALLKPKDLIGIPWRVAIALQSDGWWLRQDIIWSKPNPMPESVTDRCTKAHEYLFLLAKSERYYYDQKAIAEPFADDRNGNPGAYNSSLASLQTPQGIHGNGVTGKGWNVDNLISRRNKRSVWEIATQPFSEAHFATFPPALIEPCILAGCPKNGIVLDLFGGAGTTGLVADRLGRDAILIELNEAYADMARTRIEQDAPLFANVEQA
jgi:DNA modification methylase